MIGGAANREMRATHCRCWYGVARGNFAMRGRMQAVGTVAALALAVGFSTCLHADSLTVKTAQGKIHGKTINDGKVRAFLGLPYAAPPVGELRWKAPEPPAKWQGVRDATQFGHHCMETPAFDQKFADPGPSEDCLYLNVYTPAGAKSRSKLPVMFWIHGGGFSSGAGSEFRQDGDFLPTKGVVLVTFNYRLGVFGFMTTAEMAKEANGAAGDYGILDMIAAMQWVRTNIKKFGGDPKNVTIFGESAGSMAVSLLMASPMAQGLFAKAIGESGGAFSTNPQQNMTLEEREQRDEEWATVLGVPTLADLRAMPADKLLTVTKAASAPRFGPVVDGRVLTEPVPDTYAAGKQAHVPLLAGWNRDENASLAKGMTAEKWKQWAAENFGERAVEFLKLYPGETDEQAQRSAIDYGSDAFIAFGTWKWIEAQRKTGDAPVYRYHFELPAPPSKYHPGWFTFHSDDIEYVFGTLDTRPDAEWRPEDRKLSKEMMDYWTNFAKTGDPNGPGLPVWPKYGDDKQVMHLNDPITAAPSTVEARYEFLLQGMPAMRR
jgi:para-nitrobenzyl esterase